MKSSPEYYKRKREEKEKREEEETKKAMETRDKILDEVLEEDLK